MYPWPREVYLIDACIGTLGQQSPTVFDFGFGPRQSARVKGRAAMLRDPSIARQTPEEDFIKLGRVNINSRRPADIVKNYLHPTPRSDAIRVKQTRANVKFNIGKMDTRFVGYAIPAQIVSDKTIQHIHTLLRSQQGDSGAAMRHA